MGKYLIDESTLVGLGNAIRAKTGDSEMLSPGEMIEAIGNITTDILSVRQPVGPAYEVINHDNDAFYVNGTPNWQVGDYIFLQSGTKIGVAEITADWGGGEYVISPNYCHTWGQNGDTLRNAVVRKFDFPYEEQIVTVQFHDGNPNGGGPDSYIVSYTAGQTWRDVFSGPEYELYENHEYGGSIYFNRVGQQWVVMNVRADDPIQPHIYLAIDYAFA